MSRDATALTGTAVNEVAALARDAAEVEKLTIGGYEFTSIPLTRVDVDPRLPKPLEFYTLAGLVSYLKAEPLRTEEYLFAHVVSPTRVDVVSNLIGQDDHLRRHVASAVCKSSVMKGFAFNQYVSMESLNIALQTCFSPDLGEIEPLRGFCSAVRSTSEIGTADDGISQTVSARSGVAAVQTVGVKNPWFLAPWRTFPEILQPLAPFVLRFQKSQEQPIGGLFETGDDRWIVEAVKRIAEHLRFELGAEWKVLG